jgi:geranylgeranyl diphosphate synthase type II
MSVDTLETASLSDRRRDAEAAVKAELCRYFRTRASSAASYGASFARLWTIAGDSVLGGKLVRPLLLVEMFHALGGAESGHCDSETLTEIGAAVELLNCAFLMHDDVIDGDLTRRGRSNLVGALLSEVRSGDAGARDDADRHWARTGGILMGDLLLSGVHQLFARARLPHEQRLALLDLLDRTITESVAGEDLDVGLSAGVVAPDLATILDMSACKTAAYTFELPLRAAAVLAGAGADVDSAVSTAGRHLGLAFQLQDDLLSTFGDPYRHGKDPFSDLREGKQTAIIAYARQTSAWRTVEASFGRSDLTHAEGTAVRELLARCGARSFVEDLIDDELRACRDVAADAGGAIPLRARQVLLDLIARLEGRRA